MTKINIDKAQNINIIAKRGDDFNLSLTITSEDGTPVNFDNILSIEEEVTKIVNDYVDRFPNLSNNPDTLLPNGFTVSEFFQDTLNEFVINKKKPLFGICVGLQMFADVGYEETETKGLGWISGKVSKIDNKNGKYKLPHIGWNQINIVKDSKIFKDVENNSHMYFVHSYEFIPEDKDVISATTDYSSKVVCSVEKDNIFGTQFHPEKSDKIGLKIIENFINI